MTYEVVCFFKLTSDQLLVFHWIAASGEVITLGRAFESPIKLAHGWREFYFDFIFLLGFRLKNI